MSKAKVYIYLKDGEYSFAKGADKKTMSLEIIDLDDTKNGPLYLCSCPMAEGLQHVHKKVS